MDADAMDLKISVLEELSRIFQVLRFEPHIMQEILETPLPSVRLNLIQDLLHRAT